MSSKKQNESKQLNHDFNDLNVTTNVINVARLILKELFGEVVEALANELLHWNNQHIRTLFQGKSLIGFDGKQGQQKLCQALVILIQHNLVTFSRNEDGDG